jgi:UDP-N-acetyl-D-glucosamine 4,6-dehydratase
MLLKYVKRFKVFRPTPFKRALFYIVVDLVLSLFTLFLAYNLRFNFDIDKSFLDNFFYVFTLLISLKIFMISYFNVYKVAWRFFSLKEAKNILYAHLIAYGIFVVIYYIYPQLFNPFPRTVIIIDMFLSIIFLGFFRVVKRLILEENNNANLKKTMLIGVSELAQSLVKQKNDFYIDAIVDDSDMVVGSYFSNIKVAGFEEIEKIVKEQKIEAVIITKKLDQKVLKNLYSRLNDLEIKDILISSLSKDETRLKNLTVEDLLARHPKDLDKEKIESFIQGKTILVTGAGGSIGSEICRQCEKFGAKKLILLDNSEYNLYAITEQIKKTQAVSVMQSVVERELIDHTFQIHMPEIVIHAAAYKHVPLVEANIHEGIRNNVIGTQNIIDISIKYGVEKFVMISTDKAVRPTNVMGTTKRICELYAQNVRADKTEIVAVRFGNVLGSSGSVVPKFKSQIENGENITVTHPEITRYFMLIPEACELVLQAAAIGKGGEIFILDMGEPVKIADLAKKMIELSGKNEITIEYTGLRPGEKLYEELLINESDAKTQYDSITVAAPTFYDIDKLSRDIKELLACGNELEKLKEIVPEFNHQLN